MSKELGGESPTITFTHTLPIGHVLAYLRTVATLRWAARRGREMATHYPPGVRMRRWLEGLADRENRRADAYEWLVKTMQPNPKDRDLVVNYVMRAMSPDRRGEDLDAVEDARESYDHEDLEAMATYGFRRQPHVDLSTHREETEGSHD